MVARALVSASLLCFFLNGAALAVNFPAGIVTGTGQNVTLTSNGTSATLSNGIVSIVAQLSNGYLTQINYTYNNGAGTKTTNLLAGGNDGGQLYIGTDEYGGFAGSNTTYSVVVNPATEYDNHAAGDYGEIDLLSTSSTNGTVDIHYSMFRGSPGFYVAVTWSHRAIDGPQSIGETRVNIYNGTMFNWMSVDSARNKLMESPTAASSRCRARHRSVRSGPAASTRGFTKTNTRTARTLARRGSGGIAASVPPETMSACGMSTRASSISTAAR